MDYKELKINNDLILYYDLLFKVEYIKELSQQHLDDKQFNNWPVTYIIYEVSKGARKAYVGETTHFINRMYSHLEDNNKTENFSKIMFLYYKKATKSSVLYFESELIRCLNVGSEKFEYILNVQGNSNKHKYYNCEDDKIVFKKAWEGLRKIGFCRNEYNNIISHNDYKYSVYTSLNNEQENALDIIVNELYSHDNNKIVIKGSSGTGKSILAIHLLRKLTVFNDTKRIIYDEFVGQNIETILNYFKKFNNNYHIAYITPTAEFANIIRNSIEKVKHLKESDLIKYDSCVNSYDLKQLRVYSIEKLYELVIENNFNEKFDLVIVDEAQRIKRKKFIKQNITKNKFGKLNIFWNLNDKSQLEWLNKISKNQVIFYDHRQSIRPSDVKIEEFENYLSNITHEPLFLNNQERCLGGSYYIKFIDNLFKKNPAIDKNYSPDNKDFEFYYFDSFKKMKKYLYKKNGKCRLASGSFFKTDKKSRPIIEGEEIYWNSGTTPWINQKHVGKNEVGKIHVYVGVEVDYIGIIVGNELSYNPNENKFEVYKKNFYDSFDKNKITDDELLNYILNTYYILFTRARKGVFVYVYDDPNGLNNNLKAYLKSVVPSFK